MHATWARLSFALLLGVFTALGPANAEPATQTLDKLPTIVAEAVRDAERRCRAEQGEPVYELAHLARRYYMGSVGAGREAYVLTFDEFLCVSTEAMETDFQAPTDLNPLALPEPDRQANIYCHDEGCRIAVFLPSTRDRWVKAFDGEVISWLPQQRDGELDGPNVRLRIETAAPRCKKPAPETCNAVFRASGVKLIEDRERNRM